jgi:hypothetical protein
VTQVLEGRSRSTAGWALRIGLVIEAMIVASLGTLNALWISTFSAFEGLSALGPTLTWVVPVGVLLIVIVWGFIGTLGTRSGGDRKGWKRTGIVAVAVVNVLGFVLLAADLIVGPKFESLDYLQNLLGMVITAGVAGAAFSTYRGWSS